MYRAILMEMETKGVAQDALSSLVPGCEAINQMENDVIDLGWPGVAGEPVWPKRR